MQLRARREREEDAERIRKKEPAAAGAAKEILSRLNAMREQIDVAQDDETLNLALRVIYDSVTKRSAFAPGERSYINFATAFVRQIATGKH
jgi:hypothetical protein